MKNTFLLLNNVISILDLFKILTQGCIKFHFPKDPKGGEGKEKGRLRGNEEYRELRKGQGREVEGEGKKKVK